MRVAVTGSSGFIGRALLASLRGDGHEVVPVTRPGVWDVDAGTIDTAALEGVDAVVHLAGEGIGNRRWNAEHKRKVKESRSKGTALLAGALAGLDRPPSVLVSGSAVGFYGDRGDEVLTEASGPGDDFLAEVVTAWEEAAAPATDAGIRTAFLRTGLVLDADGGVLPRLALPFKLFLGGRLGSGRQWMSWVSLVDEVRAIRFLLDHDVAGPVNAVGPAPVTNAELAKTLGSVLRRPAVVPVPAFAPRLLLGREMADELLFVSQRVLPTVLEEAGFAFEHPTLESALRSVL